jgi:hypothetical protein
MQKFQFLLFTYQLEAPVFLEEIRPDVLTAVPLCGSFRNVFFYHTVHFTPTALDRNFLCHFFDLTHVTPQLCLRWDRLTFAASDCEPSDVYFNIRWSAT